MALARIKLSFCFLAGLLCTLQAVALQPTLLQSNTGPALADLDSLNTRQALYDRFYSERNLLVVFGATSQHVKEQMRKAIQESSWRWRSNLQVKHVDEVRPGDLRNSAVLLVGTPANNVYLTQLPSTFPVVFKKGGFTFLGKDYPGSDVLSLVYPSLQNPRYPMFVVGGWDEEAILNAINDRIRVYDYQIVRNGQRMRIGHFSQLPASLWQHDPEQDIDFEKDNRLVGTTNNFRFYANNTVLNHDKLAQIIRVREENLERIKAFARDVPIGHKDKIYQYHLYASLQDKAVITNSMQFAHVNHEQQAVHVALEDGIEGDLLNKESVLLVRSWFGESVLAALEDGLSVYLSKNWFGKPYQYWADRLAHADLQMPIVDLLDNDRYHNSSPLMREVLAGAMVSCMIDRWGKENFLDHYSTWSPIPGEWPSLDHMWGECMEDARKRYKPVEKRKRPAQDAFQKGFNFAHEGYGIINGYGSRDADEALDKLKHMGSSAVSIIPYTFMRDPNQAVSLRLPNTAGDENDGAVAHSARYAKMIGFTTMIKPQIWIRGSWPGDINMETPQAWQEFFTHYEHWITHYALLSEIFEVDILCIGTELTRATLIDQDRWASFANNLRSIYSGQLVYAPNWGEEFESLTFWEAFDYIGLNSYYPLSDLDNPTDKDLLAGAKAVVKRMEKVHKRFDKPILLTEIGYPNSPAPWKLPYQEDRRAQASPEDQARCYQAMVTALSGVDWLQGIYWWKWPSYLDRGGVDQRGFTPNNKPAEKVVADWYNSI